MARMNAIGCTDNVDDATCDCFVNCSHYYIHFKKCINYLVVGQKLFGSVLGNYVLCTVSLYSGNAGCETLPTESFLYTFEAKMFEDFIFIFRRHNFWNEFCLFYPISFTLYSTFPAVTSSINLLNGNVAFFSYLLIANLLNVSSGFLYEYVAVYVHFVLCR